MISSLRILSGMVLLCLAVAPLLPAKDIDVVGENVRVTVPDDWNTLSLADSKRALKVENGDHTGALFLDVMPNPNDERVDGPNTIRDMKLALGLHYDNSNISAKITREGPLTLDGLPFYELLVVIEKPGSPPFYLHLYNVAVNGKAYSFSLRSPKGVDGLKPLEQVMQTVHISGPRNVPAPKTSSGPDK